MKYLIGALLLFFQNSLTQEVTPEVAPVESAPQAKVVRQGVPVSSDSSITIYNSLGPYSMEKRAERILANLEEIRTLGLDITSIAIEKDQQVLDIVCAGVFIMSVTDADANALGMSKMATAQYYADQIEAYIIESNKTALNIKSLAINIGIALFIVTAFLIGLRYFNRIFRAIYLKIYSLQGKVFKGFSIKNYELLTEEKQVLFIVYAAKALRILLLILIIYLLLPVLFSLFPWTKDIANTLFGYILTPVKKIGLTILNYIPSLLTIVVIWFIAKYILKLLKFFREEVAKGRLVLPGFYPEWAKPTFNIVRALVVTFAFIAIWPLLPMSDSDIFKGVSTFVGLLVALGGAGAISNIIAGLVITFMRSFKIGDRVKIGDVIGDVKEKSMLNTRIKTIKNEIITIPNSQLLSSHTINYTTANDEDGLILYTEVTIGYDAPWRQVHELLIEAALETECVKKLPKPYVLQTGLDDFYVRYQLNARTRDIHKMAVIYSDLHKNIQDKFNEAGVEIMSPHYAAHRDGNKIAIPEENIPTDYSIPWFRFKKD